jgi:hypothetical protein
MRYTALKGILAVSCLLVSVGGGGCARLDDKHVAPPRANDSGSPGGGPTSDGAPPPPSPDGVVPGGDASRPDLGTTADTRATGDAVPPPAGTSCGNIMPSGQPVFEAIKRLATTTSEVRILVYGQSNSEMPWWQQVRDWLKVQYPHGNLVMEEHARGACTSQCLIGRDPWGIDHKTVNRVPDDVFAWNPDLIIFSVYGRHDDFETLVKGFKVGCSAFDDHPSPTAHCPANARHPEYKGAELMLQTYYREDDSNNTSPLPMLPPLPDNSQWDRWMATVWIPAIAKKYDAVLQPLWEQWGDYLQMNHLKASDLLPDGEHLTDAGNELMARLAERYLCYVPPR